MTAEAQEYFENWLTENDVDPNNIEPAHIILAMESYAEQVAIAFVMQFDQLEFREDEEWFYLPEREEIKKKFDEWFNQNKES